MDSANTFTTFVGNTIIASGDRDSMLQAVRNHLNGAGADGLLSFEDATGRQVDFDYSGAVGAILDRQDEAAAPRRGPGRPRLGVTGGQVSLFPRDWEWLESQKSGISATLRRLVDEARRKEAADPGGKHALEAAGTFLTSMAGNLPGYEEASRCLYARDVAGFARHTTAWPVDIRRYAFRLVGWPVPAGPVPVSEGG